MAKLKVRSTGSEARAVDTANSRQQLLNAAVRLFAKHGLDGTTVRDIAQEADVNLCMISYHFGGKEGLYRECLEDFGRSRIERVKGLLEAPRSAEEFRIRLKMFVTVIAESHAERPEFPRMILKEIEAGLPIATDIFEGTFLKIMQDLIQFFRSAQKAGLIHEDRDPTFLSHIIYGTIGHVTRCDAVGKRYFHCSISDSRNRECLIDTLVETFFSGIMKQDK